MAVKGVANFEDFQGQASKVVFFTTLAATVDTVANGIAAASNAGERNSDAITFTVHNVAAVAATYENAEDKAQLVFRDTSGATHKYQIPAPKSTMFLADQETVNTADPTGVIGIITANVVSLQGNAVSTFVAGKRLRRRSRRG